MQSNRKRSHSHNSGNLTDFPQFVTVPEAAVLLRVDEATVRRHCANGKLPSVKIGGNWRIRREDLLAQVTASAAA